MIIVRPLITPFIPMGMDKSGTFSSPANTTTKVTGWVERSGFPGTVIVSDALVVNGTGNITVQCQVTRSGSQSGDNVAIYKNGVQAARSNVNNFDSTRSISWTGDVVAGDTLDVRYINTSAFNAMNITAGYLYYTIN